VCSWERPPGNILLGPVRPVSRRLFPGKATKNRKEASLGTEEDQFGHPARSAEIAMQPYLSTHNASNVAHILTLVSSIMLFTTVAGLSTFILVSCTLAVETSTGSITLFLDPMSPASPYPTSDGPALAIRFRGNKGNLSNDYGEGQSPSEHLNSPIQACPNRPSNSLL